MNIPDQIKRILLLIITLLIIGAGIVGNVLTIHGQETTQDTSSTSSNVDNTSSGDSTSTEATNGDLKNISFADLSGLTAGVKDGTIQDSVVSRLVKNPKFLYYKNSADECIALEQGKVDYVFVIKEQYSFIADEYEDLVLIPQLEEKCGEVGFIFPKDEKGDALREQIDEYIRTIRENGQLEELQDYWFSSGDKETVNLPSQGENGILTVASGCQTPPFVYIQDNKCTGFEMALLNGFCREYGYGIEVNQVDMSGILPAVMSGKCNFGANALAKTAEREEEVNFSETTCQPSYSILMRSKDALTFAGVSNEKTSEQKSFTQKIARSFYKTFITEDRWKLILQGTATTVLLTLLSGIMGIVLGLEVYKARVSKKKICRKIIGWFNAIMGGTPMVVLLMIFYYIIFGRSNISAFFVAVIAFGLNLSSSMSEIYYTTIKSIDPGQMEAALALGYKEKYAFRRFILPQALRRSIPLIEGQLIALLKGTAIVGFISLQDLTKMGDLIRSRTYEAFFPLITVAVIYFIIAWLMKLIINRFAAMADPMIRRKKNMEKGKKEEKKQ